MEKHLFLTSSVNRVAAHIASQLDLSKDNKLVFITTPVEPETGDMGWLQDDRKALVDAGFDVTDYTITGKTKEKINEDLDTFTYIYMSGGNTMYLLKVSQETGFIDLVRDYINTQGKIYIGTSAGSIICGPKMHDYHVDEDGEYHLADTEGYHFVNFLIAPHWGSEHFRAGYLGKRLAISYREDQVPYLLLTDNQYIEVTGDKFQIYDTAN